MRYHMNNVAYVIWFNTDGQTSVLRLSIAEMARDELICIILALTKKLKIKYMNK